jgi:hypothetical protein
VLIELSGVVSVVFGLREEELVGLGGLGEGGFILKTMGEQ